MVPAANHVLTTGLTFYRDRSSDKRTTTTTTSMIGQVVLGPRGPSAVRVPLARAAGSAVRGASGPRSGCEPPRHRRVCAGRVDASPGAVARGRAARRFLQRDDRRHAGLRRHVGCRRCPARDRSVHASGPQRRHLREERVDRRHRPCRERRSPGQSLRPFRPQLPPSKPRGDAVRGACHRREHRAEREGGPGDGQQLRRRRQVQSAPGVGRRVRLRQPVQELRRAGPRRGDHAGGPAGAGDQLRGRPDWRPRGYRRTHRSCSRTAC